ncbi:hypothetical protein IVB18_45385 [Bradyrhizobium sp. 186]|uniref:hypothetical protein n=1 Tax=Bradyrhizobium sp. 186 TaxID=2782654 RepID=UPI0020010DD8|nr:hypothetical protein [Bradyrhizobium sp. 186]UPK35136.1 hypothetical protein IVB18_45385 [Bradyrhizobium sp. 186]
MTFYQRTRRLWMVGDSFARGYALGNLADLIAPTHPMYGFSSIWRMQNLVFEENGVNIRGDTYLIGSISQANLASDLATFFASSDVGDRDMVVFEDAGQHNSSPNLYRSQYEGVLSAVKAARLTLDLRVCTTPDNSPAVGTDYQWDVSFLGQGTMNQAAQAAAAAQGVLVIDMNTIITAYWGSVLAADGVVLPQPDNIHMRVWDQMKWAGTVLASFGLTPSIKTRTSLTQIASDNWSQLGYGSGSWSQAKAVDYCAAILG